MIQWVVIEGRAGMERINMLAEVWVMSDDWCIFAFGWVAAQELK